MTKLYFRNANQLALSIVQKQTNASTNGKIGEFSNINFSLILELCVINLWHRRPGLHQPRFHHIDVLFGSLHSTKQHSELAYTPVTVPCGVFMHHPTNFSRLASLCVNFRKYTPAINGDPNSCLELFQRLRNLHLAIWKGTFGNKNKEGPTEIWTRIAGFRVLSANHYTMGPHQ